MWHWTTRTGQYPEAMAFTRRVSARVPTVTDPTPVTESDRTEETEAETTRLRPARTSFDLAG